jgi:hypothetical protein
MNATEQFEKLSREYQNLQDSAYLARVELPHGHWDAVAIRIIQDLKAVVVAYGEKAYPISDKQMEVVDGFFARCRETINQAKEAEMAKEREEIAAAANEIDPNANITPDYVRDNWTLLLSAAKRYLRGDFKSLFEAKVEYAEATLVNDMYHARVEFRGWAEYNTGY